MYDEHTHNENVWEIVKPKVQTQCQLRTYVTLTLFHSGTDIDL